METKAEPAKPTKPAEPPPYVTTTELAAIVCIASVVIVGVVFQPEQIVMILGFGSTIIAALLAASKAQRVSQQTHELEVNVNHRLSELLEARQAESRAAGRDEQRVASEAALVEQKDEIRADREQIKADIKSDADNAAPVEVVNLPAIQQVEIVEPKGKK